MTPRLLTVIMSGALAMQAQPLRVIYTGNAAAGYLGIATADIDAERAKALKLPEDAGVEITRLSPVSPAASAGLREGDVVVQYGGERVEGQIQLERLITETPIGREVRIQVFRNGYPQTVIAKIGAKPEAAAFIAAPHGFPAIPAVPDMPVQRITFRSSLGTEWEGVDGQLAGALGARDGGVLVRSVIAGSAADRGGLRAGDVVIRVGDARVMSAPDVSARIRALRGASALVTVVREKRELSLTIPLDGGRGGQ